MGYEHLELKANLLVEGINVTEEALKGVGEKYKEQNHGLFGWDFEDHAETLLPDDFILPEGTVVQFRKNSRSDYRVIAHEGDFLLTGRGGQRICDVRWIRRPAYYDRQTSNRNKMVKIGQVGGEDCLFFCYHNSCSFFSHKQECLFCNLPLRKLMIPC